MPEADSQETVRQAQWDYMKVAASIQSEFSSILMAGTMPPNETVNGTNSETDDVDDAILSAGISDIINDKYVTGYAIVGGAQFEYEAENW